MTIELYNIIISALVSFFVSVVLFYMQSRSTKAFERDSFIINKEYDTHEKVYDEIISLKESVELSWLFSKKEKRKEDDSIMSYESYMKKVSTNPGFGEWQEIGLESYFIGLVKDKLVGSLLRLSRRSTPKIKHIAKDIYDSYQEMSREVEFSLDILSEQFGWPERDPSKVEKQYLDYYLNRNHVILTRKIVPRLLDLELLLIEYIELKK